ncbi:DEAD/DEAH box helicase [Anaerobranca gottschalkii]|uniref:Helicase conserved C-terminal domain-containing protein n=1 Tax=Anaerobranca gottschalkii DSM 13577 TaxID=1120990 RepID=A0A1H9YJI1_9FIRM|nr:DEAD/DEAH box helicase [Anaerobranca gottschalkii]SES69158.1 protein of unknown function [Anaerobranca gottschalkii DSM 13577]
MGFSPVETSKTLTEKYIRYLNTIFEIKDQNYSKHLRKMLKEENYFAKGPYLDVTDSFQKGKSILDLIEEGLLAKGFTKIKLPHSRPLYKHQEKGIRLIEGNRNLVVSTGTGSGKTETFLIPILNHLIRQHEKGKLNPGVRALLIYPMNALANDQIERLRELLADYPEITYGSYTGQTKEKKQEALAEYKRLNNNNLPKSNELISREEIKENPPHILITNYAMLEYLMIRPNDNVFFDGPFSHNWKFIVLDEAHVYNGATGIEVAMLLRRLKAKLRKEDLRYILTSATLGEEKDNKDVAAFAEKLCDSVFEEKDIIRAERENLETFKERTTLPVDFYNKVAGMINKNEPEDKIIQEINKLTGNSFSGKKEEVIYDVVLHDNNYWEIRRNLQKVLTVKSLAKAMGWEEKEVENFVTVASIGEKNGVSLFNARYHMFLKATDGAFITLSPSSKLFLTRKEEHFEDNGEEYKVFEIATCSSCHSIYLIGKEEDNYLKQISYVDEENIREAYLLGDSYYDTDEENLLSENNIDVQELELCGRCGFICEPELELKKRCGHDKRYFVKVLKAKKSKRKKEKQNQNLTKCLSCENTNNAGILRLFFTGQEAVTSVIGTSLFEELPGYEVKKEVTKIDDDTGFSITLDYEKETLKNIAKQFIAFSDSRQAAAFYACYLDQTYRNILYKRLITETLKDEEYSIRGKAFDDFVYDLTAQFVNKKIGDRTEDSLKKEAWKAALKELVESRNNYSLYGLGLMGISIADDGINENPRFNLSKRDVQNIINVLIFGMIGNGALHYAENLNKDDIEFFVYNGIEHSYTYSDSNPKKYVNSFIPSSESYSNRRLDYIYRVMKKGGYDLPRETIVKILTSIWDNLNKLNILKCIDGKYKVDTSKLVITAGGQWHICSKCKKVTMHNVHGVCPTYRCDGELKEVNLKEIFADNHYYRIFQELDIRELRVVEHTAQLNKEMAYEYQRKFKNKEIDVLSCSTTFEMGVDVGTLETVFMRNMPPSPANYAQRAGRAGRSKQAAAYSVTFCNRSSHDFYFFNKPEEMIRGRIDPPKFKIENEKIAIRHLYASALSFFWKKYQQYFASVSQMIEKLDGYQSGYDLLKIYLKTKPNDLAKFLESFLPKVLVEKFDIKNYGWVKSLINEEEGEEGVFTKAVKEYEYEVSVLVEAREYAFREGKKSDYLTERIRAYKREDILSFLSRKNVLPKYGFPVDTVELFILDKNNNLKLGLQLQRDLAMAISEYAPDSQVIANGKLITSRYIKKIPSLSWKQYDFITCECNTLNIDQHIENTEEKKSNLKECKQCGKNLDQSRKEVFLIPQFGFEADGDKIKKPGLKKPEMSYRGEIVYVGYKTDIEVKNYKIGNGEVSLYFSQHDELAVLNRSDFFVCEECGYTLLDDWEPKKIKPKIKHKKPTGHNCSNDKLKKYALGYRFETDVVKLRFLNYELVKQEEGLSLLYGILRGVCNYLNIEEKDIYGTLSYYLNEYNKKSNIELILYDKTPGGAGHVARINQKEVLEGIFQQTLKLMELCNCGGEKKDSSCYACLRNYYNQKNHDILKRSYVIDFLKGLLE